MVKISFYLFNQCIFERVKLCFNLFVILSYILGKKLIKRNGKLASKKRIRNTSNKFF